MKAIKWIIGLVVVVLIIWAIAGGDAQETVVTPEGPIKVGFIGPLTGDAAAYGEPFQKAVELAVAEVNEAGGVLGQSLEFVYEDGACAGADAANAAQKLINVDGVKVILGGFCSSESLSAEPIATAAGVLMISTASSSPDLTGISSYFARTYPSDALQGEILADIAFNDKGWTKVAVIQEQTDYAQGLYVAFDSAFAALGGETIREEFATQQTDVRTLVTKLKAEEPDAVLISVQTPASAERVLTQMSDQQWDAELMIADALAGDDATVAEHADQLEGALAAQFGLEDNAKLDDFVSVYEAAYGEVPPFKSYTTIAYDTVYLLAEGIEAVGYDADALSEWIRGVKNWDAASGSITIEDNGDRSSGHVPQKVEGGAIVAY